MTEQPFRSSRLVYRSFNQTPEDEEFIELMDSDAIANMNSGAAIKPRSKAEAKDLLKLFTEGKDATSLACAICLPITEECEKEDLVEQQDGTLKIEKKLVKKEKLFPIGRIMMSPSRGPNGVVSRHGMIGVDIIDGFRGKGYGTEAVKWITNWGFVYAGLHRVEIGCFSYNEGARRLYERMGWIQEGRHRECVWMNGEWHDTINFALLDREWKKLKEEGKW